MARQARPTNSQLKTMVVRARGVSDRIAIKMRSAYGKKFSVAT